MFYHNLNPQKALIWRIVHRDNLPWILQQGLHCGNGGMRSPDWVNIGSAELIDKRARHPVPVAPHGLLGDYVPFYFTPFSPMLMNIHSGRAVGVQKRDNDEILILVSSLHHLKQLDVPFLFSDMHAYYRWAKYYNDLSAIEQIDWALLQRRDFKRDDNDPSKFERYQAEALIHRHCPVAGLLGIVCFTDDVKTEVDQQLTITGTHLKTVVRKEWYFS